jgi:Cyclin
MQQFLKIDTSFHQLQTLLDPHSERNFSNFITHTLYTLLDLYPVINASTIDRYSVSAQKIHMLSTSTSSILSFPTLIYALKLVSRVSHKDRRVAHGSEPYLFAISLIIANKILDDKPFANKCWVKLLNMPSSHITMLEREFLDCVHFDVAVPIEEFNDWVDFMQQLAELWIRARKDRSMQSPPPSPF